MPFDVSQLGRWSEEFESTVDGESATTYAKATNDRNPRYLGGELVPPMFQVVLVHDPLIEVVQRVVSEDVVRSLRGTHGEQDMIFHRPLAPGTVVRSRAVPVGVLPKRSGTVFVFKTETSNGDGELVNEQYWTSFYRGIPNETEGCETGPGHAFPEEARQTRPSTVFTTKVDPDQTFRYAAASGDHTPIHLSDQTAQSVGFPGIIVHGLCTMAMIGAGIVNELCGSDPTRLARLSVRFSAVVFPGDELRTTAWPRDEGPDGVGHAFETANGSGTLVVRNGLAVIRP